MAWLHALVLFFLVPVFTPYDVLQGNDWAVMSIWAPGSVPPLDMVQGTDW